MSVKTMNINTIAYNKIDIQLSIEEIEFFKKILGEVQKAIEDSFTTRVGVSPRQAQGFFESIIKEIKQSDKSSSSVNFLYQEMFLFQNLLNEVCNAISLTDFERRLGKTEKEVKDILEWFCQATNEMQALQKARQTSYINSASERPKEKEVNQCCLKGDGYLITFYIKKLISFQKFVNIFIVVNIDSIESGSGIFSIKSVSKPIELEKLYNFIETFEEYINMTDLNVESLKTTFEVFKSSIFQVHALEKSITLKNEKYTLMDFLLYLPNSQASIMKPLFGVQGSVTFQEINNFILSMRQILDD
jgi:hypothetical protein